VLFHYFDQFLAEYKSRFKREHGFLRSIVKEVIERYLKNHCAVEITSETPEITVLSESKGGASDVPEVSEEFEV